MERKIGEVFQVCDTWLQCIEENNCEDCWLVNHCCSDIANITGSCTGRTDGKFVIFKKFTEPRVGEPFIYKDKTYTAEVGMLCKDCDSKKYSNLCPNQFASSCCFRKDHNRIVYKERKNIIRSYKH